MMLSCKFESDDWNVKIVFLNFQRLKYLSSQYLWNIWKYQGNSKTSENYSLVLSLLLFFFMQSIFLAVQAFLINWNEKWCSQSNILTMDHKLMLKIPLCCLHIADYHYLFESGKAFEHQTETDLLNRPGT